MHSHYYRITVCGVLGDAYREAFGDFRMEADGMTTVLTAELDQAALHGALNRIQALGLELAEVRRLAGPPGNQAAE